MAKATFKPRGAMPFSQFLIRRGIPMFARAVRAGHACFSSGAHFVEVHVHADTGEVRVPRMVGAFAAGTIVNPLTARSQLMGGQIWGLSAALHEATEIDRRTARYVNARSRQLSRAGPCRHRPHRNHPAAAARRCR